MQTITIDVGAAKSVVNQTLPQPVLRAIHELTSYELPDAYFAGLLPYQSRVYLFKEKTGTFPTGLLQRILSVLERFDYPVQVHDRRQTEYVPTATVLERLSRFSRTLRDYQAEGLAAGMANPYGLFWWPTGCHAAGTKILRSNGQIAKVEDLQVGDRLMGPDSRSRIISRLIRGRGRLFRIIPNKGEPFVVNEDHILSLRSTNTGGRHQRYCIRSRIVNLSVRDYLQKSKTFRHMYKLYRSKTIEFRTRNDCNLDPHLLGILLGDGCFRSRTIGVSNVDKNLIKFLSNIALDFDCQLKKSSGCNYRFSGIKGKPNKLTIAIKKLGLWGRGSADKFIPEAYKLGSINVRRSILAGLFDTDSHFCGNAFQYTSKSKQLRDDVAFVAGSLGLGATKRTKILKSGPYKGNVYYEVCINGDLTKIPTRHSNKRTSVRKQKKDPLCTGFKIESIGEGDYFGFEIDKDHLYLLDDFTVTHNSGKTTLFSALATCYDLQTLILTHRRELLYQLQRELQEMTGREIGIIGDGHWQPRRWTVGIVNSFMTNDDLDRKSEVQQYLASVEHLIADEVHHLGASSWWKIAHACSNTRARHGFSGTCFRTDNADLHLLANTGDVISRYTTSQMIEWGWLSRPHIYMPEVGGPVCHSTDWRVVEKEALANNDARNSTGCQFIYDRYNRGDQILAMVRLVPHGHAIKDMLTHAFGISQRDIRYMSGSNCTPAREKALADFRYGRFPILIGTSIYNEGIDLPMVGAGVNFAGGLGDIATVQRLGRVIRKKPDPALGDVNPEIEQVIKYLDFDDRGHKYTKKHARQRKKVYEDEPAFILRGAYDGDEDTAAAAAG